MKGDSMKKRYVVFMVGLIMIFMVLTGCMKDYTGNIEYECSDIYICGQPKDGWKIGKNDNGIELKENDRVFAEISFTDEDSKSDDTNEDGYSYQNEKGTRMNIHLLDTSYKNDVEAYADEIYQNDEYIQKIEVDGVEKAEDSNYNEGGYNAIYYFEPKEKYVTDHSVVLHYNTYKYSHGQSIWREDDRLVELKSRIFLNGFDFDSARDAVKNGMLEVNGNYVYYEVE